MAYNQTLLIPAHPNIYNGNNERVYRIEYSIPQTGTNEETGIVIFIPGFGGHIDSSVYKKMREVFADKYNLVTVQCDYFGSKFMQSSDNINISLSDLHRNLSREDLQQLEINQNKFYEIISKYVININCNAILDETENEFVDMSYMQAIDNITAVEAVKLIMNENDMIFNENKIIGYGHSQGAYLLHLANILSPHLFTYIIDNSSWVTPLYLYNNRHLSSLVGKATINIEFDYIAKNYLADKNALSLHNLYKDFENTSYIYSVIGTTDNLVNVQDKKRVFKNINFVDFEVINNQKVDGEIFKSTNHALDANFLKLFDYVINKLPLHKNEKRITNKYLFMKSNTKIQVDYSDTLPLFEFIY